MSYVTKHKHHSKYVTDFDSSAITLIRNAYILMSKHEEANQRPIALNTLHQTQPVPPPSGDHLS
jgi:hypothetical protein